MYSNFADMAGEIAAKVQSKPICKGESLIAIDGSDAALENTLELKEAFGCCGSKINTAAA
jgi:hypothetical protein